MAFLDATLGPYLPLEPFDAYLSLQSILPEFCLQLSRADLHNFIIKGFVSRRFVLNGRFAKFGHTRAMRSEEELTVDSFFNEKIPKGSKEPLYEGDAVSFIIEGTSELHTRGDKICLTDIPNDTEITFIYQRPSIWQTSTLAYDFFYKTRYSDEFENWSKAATEECRTPLSIFHFVNLNGAQEFLIQSFKTAEEEKSRFGYSATSLHAMRGLSLVYRIRHEYKQATTILGKTLALAYSTLDINDVLRYELLYDFGGLYLDQGNTRLAEEHYSIVERKFRPCDQHGPSLLHIKAREGLAATAFQGGLLQRAQSLLQSLLDIHSADETIEQLAARISLSLVCRAQGLLDRARALCEESLAELKTRPGGQPYLVLRAVHNLAGILAELGLLSESNSLYRQELEDLRALLGREHLDTLRTAELLARGCSEESNFSDALNIWRDLSDMHERLHGIAHPTTMEVQYQVAQLLGMNNKWEESIGILEQLRWNNITHYGHAHPIYRRTLFLLANMYSCQGNLALGESIRLELENMIPPTKEIAEPQHGADLDVIKVDNRLRGYLQKRLVGTCNWMFENQTYKAWINALSPSLLWIHGGPGSGKTILTSAIIEHLRETRRSTVFFFFDSGSSDLFGAEALLSSFIDQAKTMKPSVDQSCGSLPDPGLSPISKLFTRFSELALGFTELFCCVDAIDECGSSGQALMRLLSSMMQSNASSIKLLLSSRPTAGMLRYFENFGRGIELPNVGTMEDITKVTSFHLSELNRLNRIHTDAGAAQRLVESANGMFLWVELVMADARRNGGLLDVPTTGSLEDYYRVSFLSLTHELSMPEKELLCILLYLMVTAFRPLSVDELQIALAIDSTDKKLEELRLLSSPHDSISKLAGPFLRVDNGSVIPLHQSFLDFVCSETGPSIRISPAVALPVTLETANAYIAEICITYLLFDCFSDAYDNSILTKNLFLEYSAIYWHLHLVRTRNRRSLLVRTLTFLRSNQGFSWLDGLRTCFGKSAEDLLVIQSQISEWVSQFQKANKPEINTFVLDLYQRKIKSMDNTSSFTDENIAIISRMAEVCQASGQFKEAEALYERALGVSAEIDSYHRQMHIRKRLMAISGKDMPIGALSSSANREEEGVRIEHRNTLISLSSLASTYRSQGRWGEAEQIEDQIVMVAKRTLGEEHPDTLTSIDNLALTYMNQGRWKEAEELEVQVMDTRKRVLGEEHPDTLTSTANLASTYRNQGRWKEAEELEVQVLGTRKRVLGEEHPSTLISMGNLASTFWNQGRWKEAEELEMRVMEMRKKVLGREHPSTLSSITNLASTYRNQGRWKKAEELEVQVMETSLRVLGEEHPDTLTSMANLASTYRNQGRWKEAEELEVQVLGTRKRVLGEEHPSTLTSMGNLASTYMNQGRWKKAEELEVEVMETFKRVLGQEHPSTLNSMANLASTYRNQGRWKETEELEVQVMETRKRLLGQEHPDTLTNMNNLALTYMNQGRWKEAEELEVQVMETFKMVLGQEHPSTLTSMVNLASTYRNRGRWKEAEELEVQVMETRKRVLGQEHPDTLTNMNNLASTYMNQGRWKEAEELEVEVMETFKRVLGEKHPDTMTSMANLASTYRHQGRWKEAEELEVQMMETRERVLGREPPGPAGIIALAGLLNNAVDCFEYVQLSRKFGKSFQTNLLKLDDARLRLSRWGESVGLTGDLKNTSALELMLASTELVEEAKSRLDQIIQLFNDTHRVSTALAPREAVGGADINSAANEFLSPTTERLHVKMRELSLKRCNHTSLGKKLKWTLYEEKHFRRLSEDIIDLVNGLTELFPAAQSSQRALCEAEVSEIGIESIPALKEVAQEQDRCLEAAIAKALGQQQAQTPKVEFFGNNNSGFQMGVNYGSLSGFTFGGKGG